MKQEIQEFKQKKKEKYTIGQLDVILFGEKIPVKEANIKVTRNPNKRIVKATYQW